MPITYEVETDYLYNKGKSKGLEKAVVFALRNTTMSTEEISKEVEVTPSFVEQVRQKH